MPSLVEETCVETIGMNIVMNVESKNAAEDIG